MIYSELKTEISEWLHRNDLAGKVDLFIDLFEARASRKLRTVEMQVLEVVVPASEVQPLPSGWQAFKNVQINTTIPKPLEYASPQKLAGMKLTAGKAAYYTLNGNQVEFAPSAAGASVEWTYYKNISALSDSNTTNWLLAKHPDYYLMGCIHQALVYVMDDRADRVEQTVQMLEAEINMNDRNSMSGPLTVSAS